MRGALVWTAWSGALGSLLVAGAANALEPGRLGDDAVHLDVTDATSVLYNFDNRDTRPLDVPTRVNDEWGMWYNRFNVQASWGKWTAGLRIDNAWFYRSPYPEAIALDVVENRPATAGISDAALFRQKFNEAGAEMSNRYINWVYPAKYYVGYSTRDVEVTAGDFYASFGRGFVLSVRKMDELASDTTVRGARITGRVDAGPLKLRLSALGGEMNPLRIDEASGRYLSVDKGVTPGFIAVTEAGMPRAVETDFLGASPSYAPDRLAAAQLEVAPKGFRLGTQGSLLYRQDPLSSDVVRQADTILTGSQSLEIADFDGHGDGYLELALQSLDDAKRDASSSDRQLIDGKKGYAVYAAVTLIEKPVTFTFEGKHYRRFFALAANVETARAREFSLVQYSAPPTTEAFWVDTEFEGFNTCVTGGRLKGDVHLGKDESVFAWVGHYRTWAERALNEACDTSNANLNRVWDLATGMELTGQRRKSRANLTFGARIDQAEESLAASSGGVTNLYYQETYARYDVLRSLGGPFSLQFQGWHRRRHQVVGGPDEPWFEGQHLTGVDWSPHLSAAFGVEYSSNPGVPATYFNGQVSYKITSSSSVSAFVGQRRGALRCVGGVCRIYPPFEGARLDATVRF
ncbi:MAG: hypothetical protein IPI67_12580 [Myxococcales bacterium]|nr:hypothetical protein [Myxococcales bacterium]